MYIKKYERNSYDTIVHEYNVWCVCQIEKSSFDWRVCFSVYQQVQQCVTMGNQQVSVIPIYQFIKIIWSNVRGYYNYICKFLKVI